MKIRFLLLALILLSAANARAQFGSFGDIPIEITADGETRFIGGVAVAENNVIVHYGTASIYADYVQYNPETRDVLAIGNVRLYRDGRLVEADRALFNLETKLLRTSDFRSSMTPFFAKGETLNSLNVGSGYEAKNIIATTSDSSKPDYYFKAGNARIHPNDYITLSNVSMYVGTTRVFWFPYIYQSLKEESGFNFTPGYSSDWGAYVLNRYGIPLSDTTHGALQLDLRSKRGLAVGFETNSSFGPENKSWAHFQSYYAADANSSINHTAEVLVPVTSSRYRLSLQSRTYLSDDLYANVDINKLSDYRFLRDFYPGEYHTNPQPDNMVSLTKWDEQYTLTGIARFQANPFFDTTERLPEIALDVTRQPIFNAPFCNSPLFYESETSAARLTRDFGTLSSTDALHPIVTSSLFNRYNAFRFDTFHQLSLPQTYGGWLSVIPRIGLRGTYYSSGAESTLDNLPQAVGLDLRQDVEVLLQRKSGDPVFRPVFNAGVESSFKFSREWENVQSRALGLDGLRHVVQPYTDFSFVKTGENPNGILQFDRLTPTTELPAITFPQFTTLDAIPNWTIWRFGVRNKLQTRRDDTNYNLLTMDTFFNANFDAPSYPGIPSEGAFSNLCNQLTYAPLPWVSLRMASQIPLQNTGFTQVNTDVHFLANEDLSFSIGHRYLDKNPFFLNSSNVRFGAYYRVNDNWAFSFTDQYEFSDGTLQAQEYEIHRDLSSWIASLGFTTRENRNSITGQSVSDIGIILTFTLKDLPNLRLPLAAHPSTGTSSNITK
ncbi:MAG: LPS assembly protein LptD [Verrucomicrobia bacterium]|nr:LPS assembly protein LptD [Verrucomicrobiota bacterium]